MPQTRIHATTDAHTARLLFDRLDILFEEEACPLSIFQLPDNPIGWSVSTITEAQHVKRVRKMMEKIACENGLELEFAQEAVPRINWVAHTLRNLSIVHAGRFVIHGSHERHIPRAHQIAIEIDAGLAFGTGHHGTTAGCLDMLTKVLKRQRFHNILDLGTGSGVLAIAAAKATNAHILASDIDCVATLTAQNNTKINHVHSQVTCITACGFIHPRFKNKQPFDLIIANILAKPLQAMAHDLSCHTTHGGTVILSGLLPHQRAPLVAAFRLQGLHLVHYHLREDWLTLIMHKP